MQVCGVVTLSLYSFPGGMTLKLLEYDRSSDFIDPSTLKPIQSLKISQEPVTILVDVLILNEYLHLRRRGNDDFP